MSNVECLFCRLSSVKENIVYETDCNYVIVDRFPLSNRHLLIIPKKHFPTLSDLDQATLTESFSLTQRLAKKLKLDKYNLVQNNVNEQQIPHMHIHLVGCNETGGLDFKARNPLKLSESEYNKIVNEIKLILN